MLLPRGCVIKNVKVRRTGAAGGGPSSSSARAHQQPRAQGPSQIQNNVIVSEEARSEEISQQTSKRRSKRDVTRNFPHLNKSITITNFKFPCCSTDNRLRFYSSWDKEHRQRHHEYENQNSLPQPTAPHRSVNHHNQHHRQHQQHRSTATTSNNVHSNYRPNSFPVAYWD